MVVESKTPHNMKTIKPFEVKISENHPDKPQTWRVFLDREFTAKLRVIKKMCIRDRMKNFGSHDAKNISYNLDVKANARGYEQLATMGLKSTKRLS